MVDLRRFVARPRLEPQGAPKHRLKSAPAGKPAHVRGENVRGGKRAARRPARAGDLRAARPTRRRRPTWPATGCPNARGRAAPRPTPGTSPSARPAPTAAPCPTSSGERAGASAGRAPAPPATRHHVRVTVRDAAPAAPSYARASGITWCRVTARALRKTRRRAARAIPASTRTSAVKDGTGRAVALICNAGVWKAVEDGPCTPGSQ
jgi:hypothetical protein